MWNEQAWTRLSCYWVHWQCIVAIGWSSLLLGITCGMATLFHNCSLLGFVPLEALEGLSTQRVWHGASQREDRIKSARRSRAIHYKINDDVCGFHPVLYATLLTQLTTLVLSYTIFICKEQYGRLHKRVFWQYYTGILGRSKWRQHWRAIWGTSAWLGNNAPSLNSTLTCNWRAPPVFCTCYLQYLEHLRATNVNANTAKSTGTWV